MFDLLAALIINFPPRKTNVNVVRENLISQVNHTNHLHFRNYCDVPVEMYIRYKNTFYGWETVHFVAPSGYDGFVVGADDKVYLESDNGFFYVYAETVTKSYRWSGDHIKSVDGRQVPFQERYLSRSESRSLPPHWDLIFTCPLY